MSDIIDQLGKILEERKSADPDSSYVASLYKDGLNQILEKIGEEATELVIAAKDTKVKGDTSQVIHEAADLWFHTLVLLAHLNESPKNLLDELQNRFGTSGLIEKASRAN